MAACCALSAQAGNQGFSSAGRSGRPTTSAPANWHRLLFPDSTYTIDDGTAEDSIGLSSGGDLICLNEFTVVSGAEAITSVSIAWGTPTLSDPSLNGLPYTVVLWSDPNNDGSPTDAVVLATASGVISDQGTDTFITTDISPTQLTTPNFFVGFFISHGAGQFPAAFDMTDPTLPNRSYVAGDTVSGDFHDLNNNELPVNTIESYGLVGNWLIRADGIPGSALFATGAVSRKAHGSQGDFDIPLPFNGPIGIEDRNSTTDTIVFSFNQELAAVDGATSSCGAVTQVQIDPANSHNIIVTVNAADCDQQDITVTVNGIEDEAGDTIDSTAVTYGKLIGDVNADGVVNFKDSAAVRAARPQKTKSTNFRADLNTDGGINNADFAVVRSNRGHSLP